MRNEYIYGSVGVAASAAGTALQTNDVLQTISLVITIIGGLITFVFLPLYNWYKQAKKDGKITKDEIKDGARTLEEGVKEFADNVKKGNDHNGKVH